jgi:uncharacterized protein YggU (UPF0235/DUF167 family)
MPTNVVRDGPRGNREQSLLVDADSQIAVRLTARASKDELTGMRSGVLLARVSVPPVDGRANRALCRLIAKRVGVAPSRVSVARGTKSRDKLVRVEGVDTLTLEKILAN